MTLFLALSGLLLIIVLAVLLLPLLMRGDRGSIASSASGNAAIYTEQLAEIDAELSAGNITREQWTTSRTEIERRALEEEAKSEAARPGRSLGAAVTVAVAIPLLAAGFYLWVGNPQALLPLPAKGADAGHGIGSDQMEGMIARLAARLEKEPDDAKGWVMLGRSYTVVGRFPEAARAYANAAKLLPDDAQLLADYADALAVANGGKLEGEPAALIARALKADANNIKALALAGTVSFNRSDYKGAVAHWRKAEQLLPPDSPFVETIRGGIADAEKQLGQASPSSARASPPAAQGSSSPAAKGGTLQGRISLAKAAASQTRPDDTVFIFARSTEGPKSPIVVKRLQVKDLPFDFSLDDSMAMDPSRTLSGFPKVVLVARVSRSGNAVPQKGDLEAVTTPVAPGTKGIAIEIAKPIE